jgi:hypothetical protein
MPWGLEMSVTDPFGNRLRFTEQRSSRQTVMEDEN